MSSNVSESGKKQESADSVLLIAERDKYLQENSILLGNARQILEKVIAVVIMSRRWTMLLITADPGSKRRDSLRR